MAGLWAFGPNGLATTATLLDGLFSEAGGGWSVSTANPPRAGGKHLRCSAAGGYIRRVLGGPKTVAGFSARVYLPNLPALEGGSLFRPDAVILGGFMDAGGQCQVALFCGTDGAVVAYLGFSYVDGFGGTLIRRSAPAIRAKSYQTVEARLHTAVGTGALEVRVNNVTVLNFSGTTQASGFAEASQVFMRNGGNLNNVAYMDVESLHAWDDAGGEGPTDFVGNVAGINRPLSADTATADWLLSTGSTGYPLLGDGSDATFISTANVNDKSAFGGATVNAGITGIVYQQINYRAFKDDAGDCNVTPSFFQGASEAVASETVLSEGISWNVGIVANDPATSSPFTPAGVGTSKVQFKRTL